MKFLVRLAIFALAAWVIVSWLNKTPRPGTAPPAAPIVTPSPTPAPAPVEPAAVPAPPPSPSQEQLDLIQQLQDKVDQAKSAVQAKVAALEKAKAPILAKLDSDPDYAQAKQDADELDTKVRQARDAGSDDLKDLSQQWLDAKNKLSSMQQDALARDAGVIAAMKDLDAAKRDLDAAQQKLELARKK